MGMSINPPIPGAIDCKPCPFCGGVPVMDGVLRKGYETCPDDPDARAFFVRCLSCAATGGWGKSESSARRHWDMRATLTTVPA